MKILYRLMAEVTIPLVQRFGWFNKEVNVKLAVGRLIDPLA